jgi:hypothetical protein
VSVDFFLQTTGPPSYQEKRTHKNTQAPGGIVVMAHGFAFPSFLTHRRAHRVQRIRPSEQTHDITHQSQSLRRHVAQ